MSRWVRYGPDAVLLRFADRTDEHADRRRFDIIAALDRERPPDLIEYVPGFTTLLLRFTPNRTQGLAELADAVTRQLDAIAYGERPLPSVCEIPVIYDGIDLVDLASAKGLKPDDVVRLHSDHVYDVQLIGFAPGFPYLGPLHPTLHTARRATPRLRVPAGSVAIGGGHTGIYSVDSPGGWHIIGRTAVPLFLPERVAGDAIPAGAFLLRPGDRVRFVPDGGK
jgi:KipI family sensor histidine kinase inhibitor